jgi:hypothetical protein
MSAISSSSSGISALLQQSQQTSGPGFFGRAGFAKQRQSDFASALQSAGVDPSKVGDIQSQIDAAVQSVRQDGSTSTSGTDQRAAIKQAVDGVLQQNGVDVTKFDAALKAQHAGHAHRGGGAKKAGGDGDGDADDGGSAPSVGESQESGSTGAVTLNSQLADLLKSLANGTTQQSQFADLPAGSLVDVAA